MASRPYFIAALCAIFLGAVALTVYRLGPLALAVMNPVQTVAMLGTLVVSSALLACSLADQMSPGSVHRFSPRILPWAAAAALALMIAVAFPFHHENRFWVRIGICLKFGTSATMLVAVPMWFILRRGAVLSPRLTGPAAGMFAGLAAATALQIHCPDLEAAHILLSHLGLAVLVGIVGFLLGSFMEQLEIDRRRS